MQPPPSGQSTDHENLLPGQTPDHSTPHADSSSSSSSSGPPPGHMVPQGLPPRRFFGRTLLLLVVPPLVAAYFVAIWRLFLARDWDPVVQYGRTNEIWVFYSWFLFGVFGLEWSKSGLVGVEAAMLQRPFWRVPDVAALLFQSEATWSGPGGWFSGLRRIVRARGAPRRAHRLWYLLAALSFLVFVALPISGLCLELSDGYLPRSSHPMVIGQRWETFHERQWKTYVPSAIKAWVIGSPTTVPGIGIVYTPRYVNRDDYSNLGQLPNTMPLADGIPEMFLPPQAMTPSAGRPWGLLAGYNCTMVEDAAELTIIPQKADSRSSNWVTTPKDETEGVEPYVTLETPDHKLIHVFDSSRSALSDARNIFGYVEMGVNTSVASYDGTEPSPADDPSSFAHRATILEYVLWQFRLNAAYGEVRDDFVDTVEPSVRGLGHFVTRAENGSYVMNETFFKIRDDSARVYNSSLIGTRTGSLPLDRLMSLAPPIGVRCVVASALGHATLDPAKSTFHSFAQTSTSVSDEATTPKLGVIAEKTLAGRYMQLFSSSNSPNPIKDSNSVWYPGFIQPRVLRRSLMVAYAVDALHIMYDGTYGFGGAWENANLSGSAAGKVVTPGVVPAVVPAVLFGTWAAGCVTLALAYGFRRRWSDSLDGYSFFRFGVHLAGETRGEPRLDSAEAWALKKSQTLLALDGLVGGMRRARTESSAAKIKRKRDRAQDPGIDKR